MNFLVGASKKFHIAPLSKKHEQNSLTYFLGTIGGA